MKAIKYELRPESITLDLAEEQEHLVEELRRAIADLSLKGSKPDVTVPASATSEDSLGSQAPEPSTHSDVLSSQLLEMIREALDVVSSTVTRVQAEERILKWLWFPKIHSREAQIARAHQDTYRWILYEPEDQHQPDSDLDDSDSSSLAAPESIEIDENYGEYSNSDNPDYVSDVLPEPESTEAADKQGRGTTFPDPEAVGGASPWPCPFHSSLAREEGSKRETRQGFLRWLQSGVGTFYISGKAGSGKSTFMKFLAADSKTRQTLELWAGDKTLVIGQFFFWKAGSPLQNSTIGLYRSILWEILRQCSDITQKLFPTHWKACQQDSSTSSDFRAEPSEDELEKALKTLAKGRSNILQKYRICLFIDGLDEFSGNHWQLAKSLEHLSCVSTNIKLCLSSRPSNEFRGLFAKDTTEMTWIELQNLTRGDMLRFAERELRDDVRYAEAVGANDELANLAQSVVKRAHGVFLWTVLIVRDLLKAIVNECSTAQIYQRLDHAPSDLNGLFREMLDRIEPLERKRMKRTLFLMIAPPMTRIDYADENTSSVITTSDAWMTVYCQSVLDDLDENSNLERQILSGSLGPTLTRTQCIETCERMQKRLLGRAQGLLAISHQDSAFPYCHIVGFAHRTVIDFLEDVDIFEDLKRTMGDLSPLRVRSVLTLAAFKFIPYDTTQLFGGHKHRTFATDAHNIDSESFESKICTDLTDINGDSAATALSHDRSDIFSSMLSMLKELSTTRESMNQTVQLQSSRFVASCCYYCTNHVVPSLIVPRELFRMALCHASQPTIDELVKLDSSFSNMEPSNILLSLSIREISRFKRLGPSFDQSVFAHDSDPNRLLRPDTCTLRDNNESFLPLPAWTTWTAFLLYLTQLFRTGHFQKEPEVREAAGRVIALYLANDADPTVLFVGFFPSQIDDLTPRHLYYVDLATILQAYGISIDDNSRSILCNNSPDNRTLDAFPLEWSGIQRLWNVQTITGRDFVMLKVLPEQQLGRFLNSGWEDVRRVADSVVPGSGSSFDVLFSP